MDIHEYHAKELLSGYGVPIQPGAVAYSADQASFVASELGGWHWAVKAQIHSGARGKAGGIKLCKTYHEVHDAAKGMLGKKLVTRQTGPEGKIVQRVYVEVAEKFERELYLGIVLDRKAERVRIIASSQGGMEIEDIAKTSPQDILQVIVEPAVGLQAFQAREMAFGLGLNIKQVSRAVAAIMGAYRAFRDLDASMVEINPLVVTADDRVIALDAKMSFDDNALFRHPNVSEMRDLSQEDPREAEASQDNLSYVGLEGDIGCIINGAGLAMATMDTIKYAGGAARQLPRCGRRRLAGAGGEGIQAGSVRRQRQGHPGQHLCRHQSLRLGGAGRDQGGARRSGSRYRWWCVWRAPTKPRAARSSRTAGCPSSAPKRSPMPRRRPSPPPARPVSAQRPGQGVDVDEHPDRREDTGHSCRASPATRRPFMRAK